MDLTISYGAYIKVRRKEIGLSQFDVSELLSISTQALSQYENDKVSINLAILGDFCKVLNVDIKHFLTKTVGKDSNLVDENMFDPTKFAATLLAFRTSRNLSQKEVASALNVTNNKISKWELGNSLPSLEEFLSIANFFVVDPDELYFSLIDSFKSPEVEIVKEKPKANKTKYWFLGMATLSAIILGITLPLTINQKTTPSGSGNDINDQTPPIIDEEKTKYEVEVIYQGLEKLNKTLFVLEGELIPYSELELLLEYQEKYTIKEYLVDGKPFSLEEKIYSDLTLTIILEEKVVPQETYFKVTFFDVDKLTPLGPTQKVLKGDSAFAPDINLLDKVSGYEFEKWDKDFTNVQSDMDIYPILKKYETTLHFVSETGSIPNFINYSHEKYDELPKCAKDGFIFDGWFLLSKDRFTKETFLEKEMTLYARFVEDKEYKIYVKGFPSLPLVAANKNEYIDYSSLPKAKVEGETFLYYVYNDQIINSSFEFIFDEDIILIPYFENKIEYKKISEYSVQVTSFHSINEKVFIEKRIEVEGKRYEYTNIKTGVIDIPNATTLVIDVDWTTKFYKNFINYAPNLKHIKFLSANRYEEDRALYLEKNCLSNIETLESLEFGIARDFSRNYFTFNDFGLKVNPNFKLILIYPDIFSDYYSYNFDFFVTNKDSLEAYKNITSIEFKNSEEVCFLKKSLDIFPSLKEINLSSDVKRFKCYNFKDLDLKINASDTVNEIVFLKQDDINYNLTHAKKISFSSNNELKISGEIYSDELLFQDVNNLILDENSSLYIFKKVTFSKNTNYLNNNYQKSLVINANLDKKVDVFFIGSRPASLISSEQYTPFIGLDGGLEKDNFNFYVI